MTFLNVRLFNTVEYLKEVGWILSKKTFEYLRDSLRLIPRPIKVGTGKGTVAYYPEFSVPYLKKIIKENANGTSFTQIKLIFSAETLQILDRSEHLRRQFELDRRSRNQLISTLKAGYQPDISFKTTNGDTINIELKIQNVKRELKDVFSERDGVTTQSIMKARQLIDEVEMLEAVKRVSSTAELVRK